MGFLFPKLPSVHRFLRLGVCWQGYLSRWKNTVAGWEAVYNTSQSESDAAPQAPLQQGMAQVPGWLTCYLQIQLQGSQIARS